MEKLSRKSSRAPELGDLHLSSGRCWKHDLWACRFILKRSKFRSSVFVKIKPDSNRPRCRM